MEYFYNFIKKNEPQRIITYRRKSSEAIEILNNLNVANICDGMDIKTKRKTLCDNLMLDGRGNSRYNYYFPLNKDIEFQLRISNHTNENPENYERFELMGVPNIRNHIIFKGFGGSIEKLEPNKQPNCELDIVLNRYVYPIYFLDYPYNVEMLKNDLITMFQTGVFKPTSTIEFEKHPSVKDKETNTTQTTNKTNPNTQQQPTNTNSVAEGLYHQYELMYKLGCINEEQLRNLVNLVL